MTPKTFTISKTTAIIAACSSLITTLAATHAYSPLYHTSLHGPPAAEQAASLAARVVAPLPKGKSYVGDSYSTTIPLSQLRLGISDREILARFTRGFFGGWAFAPERVAMVLTGLSLTDVTAIQERLRLESSPDESKGAELTITKISDVNQDSPLMTDETPPAVGTLLFGNFLVLDTIWSAPTTDATTISYIDIVYGGGKGSPLSGSHRFQVSRLRRANPTPSRERQETEGRHSDDDVLEEEYVAITFSGVNDLEDVERSIMSRQLMRFHRLYSHLLFSDGIRRVLTAYS